MASIVGGQTTVKDESTGVRGGSRTPVSVPYHETLTPDSAYELHPGGSAAYGNAQGEWKRVLGFLLKNYQRNRYNPHSVVLARQMVEIAYRSFNARKEEGGWSGEFVLFVFVFAVDEMEKTGADWDSPPGTESHFMHRHRSQADITFSADIGGQMHFDRHLRPAFNAFIGRKIVSIARSKTETDRVKSLKTFLREVVTEHKKFIENAVLPGFAAVEQLWGIIRLAGREIVDGKATNLRNEIIFNTLVYCFKRNYLTEDEVRSILPFADIHTGGSLTTW